MNVPLISIILVGIPGCVLIWFLKSFLTVWWCVNNDFLYFSDTTLFFSDEGKKE